MPKIVVYTKPMCPFCVRAMALLREKNAAFEEISAAFDPEKRDEMLARSNGARTYPQIFIGETHVGGCDDLLALEASGELDGLLRG